MRMDRGESLHRAAVAVSMLFVIAVFAMCARSYGKSWASTTTASGFQNLQADALAHGQAALRVPVPRGLLALRDPYDPVANAPFRAAGIHDLSLYRGRLYSYFGVVPVVLLHLPFHLVTGSFISPTLATLLFISVGFAFLCLLWFEVARALTIRLTPLGAVGSVLVLGLGCGLPWLAFIGRSYETVIACGFALLAAGTYFLCLAVRARDGWRYAWSLAAGAVFGSLVGARPQLVLAVFIPVVACVWLWRRGEPRRISITATLWAGFAAVFLVILWFNLIRFGSPLNFGNHYQLAGVRTPNYPGNKPTYLKDAVHWYWLVPPRFVGSFPWITLQPPLSVSPFVGYSHEGVVGVLFAMPLIPFGLGCGIVAAIHAWRHQVMRPAVILGTLTLVTLSVFIIDGMAFRSATMRYELDWLPMLCLIAVAGIYSFWKWRASLVARIVMASVVVPLATWTILVNLLITRTPCQKLGSC
jgi:hypothetical protein